MELFGDGSVAQVLLSTGNTTAPGGNGYGQYQSISWGWGLGCHACYLRGRSAYGSLERIEVFSDRALGDSGGFLNPAM